MLTFFAQNFNLPTLVGAIIVFGGTGWLLWRSHKSGGSCSCGGSCGGCGGCTGGCSCSGGCCHGSSSKT